MNWSNLKNSKVLGIVMIGWIFVASVVIGRQLWSGEQEGLPAKAYYTTDDASPAAAMAALFVDDGDRLTPFDHNGKPAYRAHVFTCDGGRTTFVSHLERYTPDGLKKMRDMLDKGERTVPGAVVIEQDVIANGTQIKRPGDKDWVLQGNDRLAGPVLDVRCPDGTRQNLDAVWPR